MIVKDAQFEHITYGRPEARPKSHGLDRNFRKDNNLPIIIFNLNQRGNIRKVVSGRRLDRW